MKRVFAPLAWLLAGALLASPGCFARRPTFTSGDDLTHYRALATEIEHPTVQAPTDPEVVGDFEPHTVLDAPVEHWDVSLEEVVRLALMHSKVLRDLGGTVLRSPESIQTSYEPGIQESDPRFGPEAALSAFDAEFSTGLFFENNDRRLNNRFLGDLGFYQQDYDVFETEISKQAATGSRFTLRKHVDFDNETALGNEFAGGAWNVHLEGEVRHPLLQSSGMQFNRIAGPDGSPGALNGVLIARVRTDVSLAEFQLGLRDFISNVENAYWDLYFAYRDLDVKVRARDLSLDTWRRVDALYQAGRRGGEAEKEAQARAQYFQFEEEVQNALAGRPLEGTRTNNGSSSGTFRGISGVHVAERRLRLLIGLPLNGQQLIRPADEPSISPIVFDWGQITTESLARRAELRRQRWRVKGHELQLIAHRNFLLPDLDVVGRYRWRGFGAHLIDSDTDGVARFDNAMADLTGGDFQEWQMGVEFSMPIGYRQAHAAVRNSELSLAREKTVLREQERQVVHDLSNAVAEMKRAYQVMQIAFNRRLAAQQQLASLQAAYEDDKVEFFVVLDALRRCADAESRYYQSMVEYTLAHRNVHFEKGTLLDYCGVALAEGPWPRKAYLDAAKRERLRGRPRPIDYGHNDPPIVSRGVLPPSNPFRDEGL